MDLLGDSVQPQAANAKDSSYSTAHTSRKQKLALRWHDGSKGLAITTEGQLHYLFERFPMTYSAHECEQLLLALHKTGKIHSSKSAILGTLSEELCDVSLHSRCPLTRTCRPHQCISLP